MPFKNSKFPKGVPKNNWRETMGHRENGSRNQHGSIE